MSKNRWRDHYSDKAQKAGYFARSVFKLKEADEKFGLVRKGFHVLDLGCAPGSWMQYLSERVGDKGLVVGVDLNPPKYSADNAEVLVADVFELDVETLERFGLFDLVVSDLAPATTGVSDVDAARSLALAARALDVACTVLKASGTLFVKVFEGPDTGSLRREMMRHFAEVRAFKPRASRSKSREYYLVGLGFERE